MAANVLVDAGFLVALLNRRDTHYQWAVSQGQRYPPPWTTCESVLSEAFHLLGTAGSLVLDGLLRRDAVRVRFDIAANLDAVLKLRAKYADVPASLADACLIRMTEILAEPLLITTDTDFRVYRRHGRTMIPFVAPI